ncbi:CHAP domain-containing protein, partial [Enterococcus plantarum]|uniref:CHAP domain-containing protein n=1 Tax=Enterococcus plantarum TaxID=1077675 RepID=UPI001F5F89B5
MVTQAQALQWAKNSIGRSYDFDNSYDGVQCFDLVNQYSHDLFRISFTGTYAKDLMQTGNVGGFKVIPNSPGFYPQPGDIFVYNYGSAGHTGIVTGNINTTGFDGIDQNGNNKNDATTHRRFNYNGFAGVVRPPFTVSLPQDIGVQELFKISSSSIKTRGWHISSKVKPGLFSFIFIMDANTDKELLRIPIQRSNRPDVLNAYPSMPLANTSGFDVNFLIPANMKGKKIRIVSRYSLTKDGNNIVSDYNYPVSKTIPTFRTVADQNTF